MSRKYLTPIDLVQNEIQNVAAQNLAGAPSTPVKGQFYMNSTTNTLMWWDGTAWQSAKGGTSMTFGSVTAEQTFGAAPTDGVSANASHSDHKHGNPTHLAADHAAIPLSALAAATAAISMGGFPINNVGAPVNPNDAANKAYVDATAQGLDSKASVKAATAGSNIALTGAQTIDGIALVAGDRALVKDQLAPETNGIYVVSASAWTRALDMDSWAEIPSAYTFVEQGATQQDSGWVCTSDASGGVLGTSAITWVQFSGAGQIIAGAGLTKTGNSLDVGAGTGVTVAADTVGVNFAGTGSAATASKSDHDHSVTYVPLTRNINTTAPLTGGGSLAADKTLAITSFAGAAAGAVPVSVGGTANFLRADGTWNAPVLDTVTGDGRWTRKFAQAVGGAVTANVPHNLNTRDVEVQVYRSAAPYDTVECDVERTDANNVLLRFAIAPNAGDYRAVVFG